MATAEEYFQLGYISALHGEDNEWCIIRAAENEDEDREAKLDAYYTGRGCGWDERWDRHA